MNSSHYPKLSHTLILEYSSFIEKDIRASVESTDKFFSQLRRWLLSRSNQTALAFGSTPQMAEDTQRTLWEFARALPTSKASLRKIKSRKLVTVIRSPFVYKKTREQFGLKKHTYSLRLKLTRFQQSALLQWVSQLKLPAELKLRFQ